MMKVFFSSIFVQQLQKKRAKMTEQPYKHIKKANLSVGGLDLKLKSATRPDRKQGALIYENDCI